MILTGKEIENQIEYGNIIIEPFNHTQLNPNSYNLQISNVLQVYECDVLDMRNKNCTKEIIVPDDGLVLEKGVFYLAKTVERTYSRNFVPILEGRSSIARLGLFVHITAGFGDTGFDGCWTLELYPTMNLKIYPNTQVCQVSFHTVKGEITEYKGKYGGKDIQPSELYKDFIK